MGAEMFQLLNDVFKEQNPSLLYQGYMLLPSYGLDKSKFREIEYIPDSKKEIWYLFFKISLQ